jgi:hypothetical protein
MSKPAIIVPNLKLLNSVFDKDPPKEKGLNKEKLLYVISFVYYHQMKHHDSDSQDNGYGVTISSKMFQGILAKTYKQHFQYLCDNNILKMVSKHLVGVTSRIYLLNSEFLTNPGYCTIESFTFGRTLKRINKKPQHKYDYLEKWLKKIDFDVEYATVFNNLMFESRKNYQPFQTISKKNRKRLSNPISQFAHGQVSILKMKDKDHSITIDKKGMRLHTHLTNCPKLLRNYITIGGQHLVSIDVKNRQPYMLLALLDPNNFKKNSDTSNPHLTIPTTLLSTYNIPSIILGHSSIIQASKEFQEYKKLVTSGKIYDDFVKSTKIDKKELDNGFSKRDIVKFRFMLCFYSANNANSQGMKTLFRSKFPKIYALMCDLKEKDHTTLSILLQRVESILILDKICGRISTEFPRIPLLTIHDSVLTIPKYVDQVVKVINEETKKFIGIEPMLSIEDCSPKINQALLLEMDREVELKVPHLR